MAPETRCSGRTHQLIKRRMRKLALLLSFFISSSAWADFTVVLDAGQLRINSTTPMPVGSLLILVAAGNDSSFSNSLSPGQYVSGNDILLSAVSSLGSSGAFNTSGGTNETINTLVIPTNLGAGDLVALRWFPDITKAEFDLGVTPAAGFTFGTYNPSMYQALNGTDLNPDGGNDWVTPSAGATVNLNFFTTDSDLGGTQMPFEGFAQFAVVPEPSTYALLAVGGGLALFARRRRAG